MKRRHRLDPDHPRPLPEQASSSATRTSRRGSRRKNPQGATTTTTASYDYTLRPILFVVPRGSPPEAFRNPRARKPRRCARTFPELRRRHSDGAQHARRRGAPPVTQELRGIAARRCAKSSTRPRSASSTPPESTQQGVEVYAVCARKERPPRTRSSKKEAREEMFSEQFNSHARRYLKELRSQAMIEYTSRRTPMAMAQPLPMPWL